MHRIVNTTNHSLYAWQREALIAWSDAGQSGIVEAVTGTGKTRVGLSAIDAAVHDRRCAVVLVPTKELQRQWRAELRPHFPSDVRIGLLGDGHHDELPQHNVLIAIVNSARMHPIDAPDGSLLVADECHRYASPENQLALLESYDQRLGLTATLERPDGLEQELIDYFGPVCYRMGYAQALTDAVVAQFSLALIGSEMSMAEALRYESLSRRISELFKQLMMHGLPSAPFFVFLREVKKVAEDALSSPARSCAREFLRSLFERKDLLANSEAKLARAVALAPAMRVADRTLVFTESMSMAEHVATRLQGLELSAAAIHSALQPEKRRTIFRRFRAGALKVIVAPRVLDEGIDVPAADLAVIVSASRTRRQMIQRMGRVLRRKEDGRLARLAILYLEGTTEDPHSGAHEAFLSEVTAVADDLDDFSASRLDDALEFLCITEPFEPARGPRLEGDPPRASSYVEIDDEAVSTAEFLDLP